jgi:hypothetical protein
MAKPRECARGTDAGRRNSCSAEFDREGSAISDPRDPLWTEPSACLWSDRVVLIQLASLVSIFALDPMFAE